MHITPHIVKRTLHLKAPYRRANETRTDAEILFLSLESREGEIGLGSCAPGQSFTDEKVDEVFDLISEHLVPSFFDLPLSKWYYYHEKIQHIFVHSPAACHMVEEAVLNLFCFSKNISPATVFGGYRNDCPIMYTIGIMGQDETISTAKEKVLEGFKTLKLKIGSDVVSDIDLVKQIRLKLPHQINIILDANEGYTLKQAKKLVDALADQRISLIEQPVPRSDIGDLASLHHISSIPIIADESAVSVEEATQLLLKDCVAGVNIKLMKCGGPINFMKIFHLAKTMNKIIMIGCNHESHVSITTGAQLATALPIDFVDLDSGHLDFNDDPVTGGAKIIDGRISLSSKPLHFT